MGVPGEVVFSKTWSSWAAASLFMATILAEKWKNCKKVCEVGGRVTAASVVTSRGSLDVFSLVLARFRDGIHRRAVGKRVRKSGTKVSNRPFRCRTHGGKIKKEQATPKQVRNQLDSSAPTKKRGKEREGGKKKKKTLLKKIILAERLRKKNLRNEAEKRREGDHSVRCSPLEAESVTAKANTRDQQKPYRRSV